MKAPEFFLFLVLMASLTAACTARRARRSSDGAIRSSAGRILLQAPATGAGGNASLREPLPSKDTGGGLFWHNEPRMPCPPDRQVLGRAGWTLLHAMAAKYPSQPSEAQQDQMRAFMAAFGELYPCPACAKEFRARMAAVPPDVSSDGAFSAWMCDRHNEVNVRLGKRPFNCSLVFERWRDGPAAGEPPCVKQ